MSDQIRAIVDGKAVVGWYCWFAVHARVVDGCRADVVELIEIDPATAAVDTGRKDKHGKPIFGSKGIWQGGDVVKRPSLSGASIWWGGSGWYIGSTYFGDCDAELEIIPKEDGSDTCVEQVCESMKKATEQLESGADIELDTHKPSKPKED